MTLDEREKLFKKELNELLEKHKCTIDLEQRGRVYMEYEVIVVNLNSVYDKDGNVISEYGEFDL